MIIITDKKECCGCTACYSICPKGAIEMAFDEEGFRYPKINNEKCIDCGLCDRVCPKIAPYEREDEKFSRKYAIQNTSDEERIQSTAGGFFSVIADFIIEAQNGIVFAVGFNGVTIAHKEAKSIKELEEMRGSKYVQSSLGDTFSVVKKCLQEGKKCLFVGTPCQVNGIEKFLSNDRMRENLITIDLLCLGVSSPVLYEKWVKYLEEKYQDKVKRIFFRDKSYGYATANVRVCFENKKHLEQVYDAKSLMKTFFDGYNMRPSCYDCDFRCVDRAGDFTIGDFHQIGNVFPDMDDDKGTTCVWAHSENARCLMEILKDKMRIVTLEKKCSSKLGDKSKLTPVPDNRKEFFDDANFLAYKVFIEKWAKNDLKGKVINFARKIINKLPFRSVVFKMMKNIKTKSFQKRVRAANAQSGGIKDE